MFHKENNHNYLTEDISSGCFDGYDNPPWDTWVGEFDDALVAWVPPELFSLVNNCIQSEVIGMLVWADLPRDDRNIPSWLMNLARRVRAA